MEPQKLTDDWQPYTGGYRKVPYAIRLKDGREFDWTWPNAGFFNADKGAGTFPLDEVTHVKRGKDYHLYSND